GLCLCRRRLRPAGAPRARLVDVADGDAARAPGSAGAAPHQPRDARRARALSPLRLRRGRSERRDGPGQTRSLRPRLSAAPLQSSRSPGAPRNARDGDPTGPTWISTLVETEPGPPVLG